MSLATRCAACGTVFRVVQDQLRVSSGWVRCGRCGEVFNAVDSLVDLEVDRPGEDGAPSLHGARVMEDLAKVAGVAAPRAPASEGSPDAPSQPVLPTDVGQDDAGLASPGSVDALGQERAAAPEPGSQAWNAPSTSSASGPVSSAARTPHFVRRADRAARWRRPGVRVTLAVLSLIAATTLLWQVHRTHHDWIAARWPALKPVVERVCVVAGCRVTAPRRIESLAVESSGLVREGAPGRYRLSVVLRNRDAGVVRAPALDLSLSDAGGLLVARRVLDLTGLGVPVEKIAGHADLALEATLRVAGAPVAGYTIELFYP